MRLLLIHGRSQGGKDPVDLQRSWLGAAAVGFRAHRKALDTAVRVDFPYYGDLLDKLTVEAALSELAEATRKGPGQDTEFERFQRDVLLEMARRKRIPDAQVQALLPPGAPRAKGPQNWPWVLALARLIDRRLTPASTLTIETFLRDVFLYVTRPAIAKEIDRTVEKLLTSEPTVVVSHSLGTIVAYNVVRKHKARLDVRRFVTLGSPLGITAITGRLGPIENPATASGWYNAYDSRDIVALNPLRAPFFGVSPAIENNGKVRNRTANRHGIDGYLDDTNVASVLLAALS